MSGGVDGTVMSRRGLLAAVVTGTAAAPLLRSAGALADEQSLARPCAVRPVPLARETVRLGVLQLPAARPDEPRELPLRRMITLLERSVSEGQRHDLVWCPADALLPPPGARPVKALLAEALSLDGPEIGRLAAWARQHRCYLGLGVRLRLPDWPGRVVAANLLLDDRGRQVAVHWQARHGRGYDGALNDPGVTVVEDVLPRYLERYGPEAVLPVTATPVGTLAMHAVEGEPELLRVLALRGCELVLRSAPRLAGHVDMAAGSLHNGIFTAVAASSGPRTAELAPDCRSVVVGPRGELLAAAGTGGSQCMTVRLPMAALRARRLPADASPLVAAAAQPSVRPNRSSSSRSS